MLPRFITISNIESNNPTTVVSGNERVILPRLTDARFFFEQDKKHSLESKLERLGSVVFQSELGSYRAKTERVSALAEFVAGLIGADPKAAARAAKLCKSDLVSDMVNEFPDLQGIMGSYYARHEGEPDVVADAIREHYQPTSSGGALPISLVSKAVAIADKLDTLVGMFGIGQPPSGSRDPFALRRQTIGIVRMCVEGQLDFSVKEAVQKSIEIYAKDFDPAPIYEYLAERLKSWYQEQGVRFDSVDAVVKTANWQANLSRTNKTIRALEEFRSTDHAEALIAANKRVANILKKGGSDRSTEIDATLFQESAEGVLLNAIADAEASIAKLSEDSDKLIKLGEMRECIDRYFDDVMVMSDDEQLKANRIATLTRMRQLFLQVADISLLQQ
jgi:glycyl-tRNA synthetase beta chain